MEEEQLYGLLQKYKRGEASAEEQEQLLAWYDSLYKTKEPFAQARKDQELVLQQMLNSIHSQLGVALPGKRDHKVTRYVGRWWAAAAAIIILCGVVWMMVGKKNDDQLALHHGGASGNATAMNVYKTVRNTGTKNNYITLSDSSVVQLFPGAEISYYERFAWHERNVCLKGSAFFKVTKDKERPFAVYAGGMATRVLGTSFHVTETKGGMQVKLFTGKVMVTAESALPKGWNNPVHLSPGEQLTIDTLNNSITITKFVSRPEHNAITKLSSTVTEDADELIFTSTPLKEVLDVLSGHTHRAVQYDAASLAGMYFSGRVYKKDSLDETLRLIGNLNKLNVEKTGDGFLVFKVPK